MAAARNTFCSLAAIYISILLLVTTVRVGAEEEQSKEAPVVSECTFEGNACPEASTAWASGAFVDPFSVYPRPPIISSSYAKGKVEDEEADEDDEEQETNSFFHNEISVAGIRHGHLNIKLSLCCNYTFKPELRSSAELFQLFVKDLLQTSPFQSEDEVKLLFQQKNLRFSLDFTALEMMTEPLPRFNPFPNLSLRAKNVGLKKTRDNEEKQETEREEEMISRFEMALIIPRTVLNCKCPHSLRVQPLIHVVKDYLPTAGWFLQAERAARLCVHQVPVCVSRMIEKQGCVMPSEADVVQIPSTAADNAIDDLETKDFTRWNTGHKNSQHQQPNVLTVLSKQQWRWSLEPRVVPLFSTVEWSIYREENRFQDFPLLVEEDYALEPTLKLEGADEKKTGNSLAHQSTQVTISNLMANNFYRLEARLQQGTASWSTSLPVTLHVPFSLVLPKVFRQLEHWPDQDVLIAYPQIVIPGDSCILSPPQKFIDVLHQHRQLNHSSLYYGFWETARVATRLMQRKQEGDYMYQGGGCDFAQYDDVQEKSIPYEKERRLPIWDGTQPVTARLHEQGVRVRVRWLVQDVALRCEAESYFQADLIKFPAMIYPPGDAFDPLQRKGLQEEQDDNNLDEEGEKSSRRRSVQWNAKKKEMIICDTRSEIALHAMPIYHAARKILIGEWRCHPGLYPSSSTEKVKEQQDRQELGEEYFQIRGNKNADYLNIRWGNRSKNAAQDDDDETAFVLVPVSLSELHCIWKLQYNPALDESQPEEMKVRRAYLNTLKIPDFSEDYVSIKRISALSSLIEQEGKDETAMGKKVLQATTKTDSLPLIAPSTDGYWELDASSAILRENNAIKLLTDGESLELLQRELSQILSEVEVVSRRHGKARLIYLPRHPVVFKVRWMIRCFPCPPHPIPMTIVISVAAPREANLYAQPIFETTATKNKEEQDDGEKSKFLVAQHQWLEQEKGAVCIAIAAEKPELDELGEWRLSENETSHSIFLKGQRIVRRNSFEPVHDETGKTVGPALINVCGVRDGAIHEVQWRVFNDAGEVWDSVILHRCTKKDFFEVWEQKQKEKEDEEVGRSSIVQHAFFNAKKKQLNWVGMVTNINLSLPLMFDIEPSLEKRILGFSQRGKKGGRRGRKNFNSAAAQSAEDYDGEKEKIFEGFLLDQEGSDISREVHLVSIPSSTTTQQENNDKNNAKEEEEEEEREGKEEKMGGMVTIRKYSAQFMKLSHGVNTFQWILHAKIPPVSYCEPPKQSFHIVTLLVDHLLPREIIACSETTNIPLYNVPSEVTWNQTHMLFAACDDPFELHPTTSTTRDQKGKKKTTSASIAVEFLPESNILRVDNIPLLETAPGFDEHSTIQCVLRVAPLPSSGEEKSESDGLIDQDVKEETMRILRQGRRKNLLLYHAESLFFTLRRSQRKKRFPRIHAVGEILVRRGGGMSQDSQTNPEIAPEASEEVPKDDEETATSDQNVTGARGGGKLLRFVLGTKIQLFASVQGERNMYGEWKVKGFTPAIGQTLSRGGKRRRSPIGIDASSQAADGTVLVANLTSSGSMIIGYNSTPTKQFSPPFLEVLDLCVAYNSKQAFNVIVAEGVETEVVSCEPEATVTAFPIRGIATDYFEGKWVNSLSTTTKQRQHYYRPRKSNSFNPTVVDFKEEYMPVTLARHLQYGEYTVYWAVLLKGKALSNVVLTKSTVPHPALLPYLQKQTSSRKKKQDDKNGKEEEEGDVITSEIEKGEENTGIRMDSASIKIHVFSENLPQEYYVTLHDTIVIPTTVSSVNFSILDPTTKHARGKRMSSSSTSAKIVSHANRVLTVGRLPFGTTEVYYYSIPCPEGREILNTERKFQDVPVMTSEKNVTTENDDGKEKREVDDQKEEEEEEEEIPIGKGSCAHPVLRSIKIERLRAYIECATTILTECDVVNGRGAVVLSVKPNHTTTTEQQQTSSVPSAERSLKFKSDVKYLEERLRALNIAEDAEAGRLWWLQPDTEWFNVSLQEEGSQLVFYPKVNKFLTAPKQKYLQRGNSYHPPVCQNLRLPYHLVSGFDAMADKKKQNPTDEESSVKDETIEEDDGLPVVHHHQPVRQGGSPSHQAHHHQADVEGAKKQIDGRDVNPTSRIMLFRPIRASIHHDSSSRTQKLRREGGGADDVTGRKLRTYYASLPSEDSSGSVLFVRESDLADGKVNLTLRLDQQHYNHLYPSACFFAPYGALSSSLPQYWSWVKNAGRDGLYHHRRMTNDNAPDSNDRREQQEFSSSTSQQHQKNNLEEEEEAYLLLNITAVYRDQLLERCAGSFLHFIQEGKKTKGSSYPSFLWKDAIGNHQERDASSSSLRTFSDADAKLFLSKAYEMLVQPHRLSSFYIVQNTMLELRFPKRMLCGMCQEENQYKNEEEDEDNYISFGSLFVQNENLQVRHLFRLPYSLSISNDKLWHRYFEQAEEGENDAAFEEALRVPSVQVTQCEMQEHAPPLALEISGGSFHPKFFLGEEKKIWRGEENIVKNASSLSSSEDDENVKTEMDSGNDTQNHPDEEKKIFITWKREDVQIKTKLLSAYPHPSLRGAIDECVYRNLTNHTAVRVLDGKRALIHLGLCPGLLLIPLSEYDQTSSSHDDPTPSEPLLFFDGQPLVVEMELVKVALGGEETTADHDGEASTPREEKPTEIDPKLHVSPESLLTSLHFEIDIEPTQSKMILIRPQRRMTATDDDEDDQEYEYDEDDDENLQGLKNILNVGENKKNEKKKKKKNSENDIKGEGSEGAQQHDGDSSGPIDTATESPQEEGQISSVTENYFVCENSIKSQGLTIGVQLQGDTFDPAVGNGEVDSGYNVVILNGFHQRTNRYNPFKQMKRHKRHFTFWQDHWHHFEPMLMSAENPTIHPSSYSSSTPPPISSPFLNYIHAIGDPRYVVRRNESYLELRFPPIDDITDITASSSGKSSAARNTAAILVNTVFGKKTDPLVAPFLDDEEIMFSVPGLATMCLGCLSTSNTITVLSEHGVYAWLGKAPAAMNSKKFPAVTAMVSSHSSKKKEKQNESIASSSSIMEWDGVTRLLQEMSVGEEGNAIKASAFDPNADGVVLVNHRYNRVTWSHPTLLFDTDGRQLGENEGGENLKRRRRKKKSAEQLGEGGEMEGSTGDNHKISALQQQLDGIGRDFEVFPPRDLDVYPLCHFRQQYFSDDDKTEGFFLGKMLLLSKYNELRVLEYRQQETDDEKRGDSGNDTTGRNGEEGRRRSEETTASSSSHEQIRLALTSSSLRENSDLLFYDTHHIHGKTTAGIRNFASGVLLVHYCWRQKISTSSYSENINKGGGGGSKLSCQRVAERNFSFRHLSPWRGTYLQHLHFFACGVLVFFLLHGVFAPLLEFFSTSVKVGESTRMSYAPHGGGGGLLDSSNLSLLSSPSDQPWMHYLDVGIRFTLAAWVYLTMKSLQFGLEVSESEAFRYFSWQDVSPEEDHLRQVLMQIRGGGSGKMSSSTRSFLEEKFSITPGALVFFLALWGLALIKSKVSFLTVEYFVLHIVLVIVMGTV